MQNTSEEKKTMRLRVWCDLRGDQFICVLLETCNNVEAVKGSIARLMATLDVGE
jgi:hypothetical protein